MFDFNLLSTDVIKKQHSEGLRTLDICIDIEMTKWMFCKVRKGQSLSTKTVSKIIIWLGTDANKYFKKLR